MQKFVRCGLGHGRCLCTAGQERAASATAGHNSRLLQSACHAKDAYYKSKEWARQHHLCMPQVPLPQPLLDIINEWFCLVDDDGSGSLSASELEMAFTVRPYVHSCCMLMLLMISLRHCVGVASS